jgi:hypothetical protein
MKAAACHLPERARRERAAPPRTPAPDGPPADAKKLRQMSGCRRLLPHRRNQHHHGAEPGFPTEEAERRRRIAAAAEIHRAAEAEPLDVLLAKPARARHAACAGTAPSAPPRHSACILPRAPPPQGHDRMRGEAHGIWHPPAALGTKDASFLSKRRP